MSIKALFIQILVLCLYLVPGVLLRRMKFGGGEKVLNPGFPKGLSALVLYIAQPCMMISPYIRDFDASILKNMIITFVLSVTAHAIFIGLSYFIIRKRETGTPDASIKVMRLAIIFSNCGYMGIPLIEALLGPEAAIYATVYNISFQLASWSVGFFIASGDKKYFKKAFVSPAMFSIYAGILIFILPINKYIPDFATTFINTMKELVLPLSLCVVGFHFGGNTRESFRKNSANVLKVSIIRGIVAPAVVFVFLWIFKNTIGNVFELSNVPLTVAYICSATPCATLTSMLSEKFDLDRSLSGVLVPVSTLFSIVTMPLMALLLKIL